MTPGKLGSQDYNPLLGLFPNARSGIKQPPFSYKRALEVQMLVRLSMCHTRNSCTQLMDYMN